MTIITGFIEHCRPVFNAAVPGFTEDHFQVATYWSHDLKTTLVIPEDTAYAKFTADMELRAYGDMADGRSSETDDYLLSPGFANTHILMGPGDELEEPTLEIMRLGDAPGPTSGGTF